MKTNVKNFKGRTLILKVKDAIKEGKNIYKNVKGHENEINEFLIDLSNTGLKRLVVCMNILYSAKVNGEFKMTRGHSHNTEEVYLVLKGKGYMFIGNDKVNIKKGDLVTIPANRYHRTVNTGKEELVFLTIFEKHKASHLKK
jgi:oxalate decarboxylase/phosphoglucose isomerase-like protein (cupin superfamily)